MQKLRTFQFTEKSHSGSSLKEKKIIFSRRNSSEGLEIRMKSEKNRMVQVLKGKNRKIERLKEKNKLLSGKIEEYLKKVKKVQVLEGFLNRKEEKIREIKQNLESGKGNLLVFEGNYRGFKGKNGGLQWKIRSPKTGRNSLTGRRSVQSNSPEQLTETAEKHAKLKSLFEKASLVLGGWKKL
jgi:TolA-binding protein